MPAALRALCLLFLVPLPACASASFGGGNGVASPQPKSPDPHGQPAAPAPTQTHAHKPAPASQPLGGTAAGTVSQSDNATDAAQAQPAPQPAAPAAGPVPDCTSLPSGSLIDFEDLAQRGATEGSPVDHQYEASHGITFSLEGGGSPELIAVDGNIGAWICSSFDCSSRINGTRPGEHLGRWVITSGRDSDHQSTPLLITYKQPVDEASAMIIDVDRGETYTVEALNAQGVIVQTVTLVPPAGDVQEYDGRGMTFSVQRGGASDIASLRIQGVKDAWAGGIGLAFDNFSPDKACK